MSAAAVGVETVWVAMRDGVRLATDLYLPPERLAPAIAMRTPYGRATFRDAFLAAARRGYVVVSQDCRGTGDSAPDHWDYYMYEREDGFDFVEWVTQQPWFDGFVGSVGGSYVASTQWCMAMHPAMSAIAPQVGGLGVAPATRPRFHMFSNAHARSVGKGPGRSPVGYDEMERRMLDETLAGGYFNEPLHAPQRRLYERFCALGPAERAELVAAAVGEENVTTLGVSALAAIFGHERSHDAYVLPRLAHRDVVRALQAPALMVTGWYDWCLDDALATWELLSREAPEPVRSRSRLVITPGAHNMPGYHEGTEPELRLSYRMPDILELLLAWFSALRDGTDGSWARVAYYLMGANEWRTASAWPPPEAEPYTLYLATGGALTPRPPEEASDADRYTYDPEDPTPTVGGSIVSYVYPPGSVDVSEVQRRPDVVTYTTAPLEQDLDVVGPLRLVLHASSTAVDTDFSARLSDVFPDGRAIQLQSVTLRARYRNPDGDPELLEPRRVYCFDIDMYATANRFRAGHRLRLDISSADFPKFERHTNRAGEPGPPIPAEQAIYHDPERPSKLVVSSLPTR